MRRGARFYRARFHGLREAFPNWASVNVAVIAPRDGPSKFKFEQIAIADGQ